MDMKQSALKIFRQLREAGHQAYWVGGCVRDLLLGIPPKDFDVATSARPEEVRNLFPDNIPVGAKFGVVLVLQDGHPVEVSTFRSDGAYEDGRHPSGVAYSADPREDVLRRDFTINGLLYDPEREQVLDFVGGRDDLQNRILRAIGEPLRRFQEDHLRLLRAVRFAARFEFRMDPETRRALPALAGEILKVSPERIRDELLRLLCEGYAARALPLLEETGLLERLLPEVSAMRGVPQPPEFHPEGDVWQHTLLLLRFMDDTFHAAPPDYWREQPVYPGSTLALGALLHDIGKPRTLERADRIRFNRHAEAGAVLAEAICARLRFSTRERERVTALVQSHLRFIDWPRMKLSTMKRFIREKGFEEHLELHRLDCLASHGNLQTWHQAREMLLSLPAEIIRPPRLLSGDDLIQLGYAPGPVFQKILRAAEDAQLEGRLNSHAEAIQFVVAYFKQDEAPG